MFAEKVLFAGVVVGFMLLAPSLGVCQGVTCQPLSDVEVAKFVTGHGQILVKDSAVQCKVDDMITQIRFRIIDHTAAYDCEIRGRGEKQYCWRLF